MSAGGLGEAIGVAGTFIGVASLTLQVFHEVFKGFQILGEAASAEESHEFCRLLVQIQYARLEEWALASGLDANDPREYETYIHRNEAVVVATLTRLDFELKRLRATELEFEFLNPETRAHVTESAAAEGPNKPSKVQDISEPDGFVKIPDSGHLKAKLDLARSHQKEEVRKRKFFQKCQVGISTAWDGTKKVVTHPKRFKWAIASREVFESRLQRVRDLVDSLTMMLSRDQLNVVRDNTETLIEMLLHLSPTVTEIKSLVEAMHASGTVARSVGPLSGSSLRNSRDDQTASFWASATHFVVDAADVDLSKVVPIAHQEWVRSQADGYYHTVESSGQWIEWKTFTTGPAQEVPRDTQDKVKKLVALLQLPGKPVEFGIPTCLGYFRHPSENQYGLVFQSPTKNAPPYTLRSLYETKDITLSTKMSIAQKMAQWLLCFHTVNWLHKGLRSRTVMFFPDQPHAELGQLFVGGYDYSRSASDRAASLPTPKDDDRVYYTHPSYLETQQGYRKTYDMYSLGIILVEIAYWERIDNIPGLIAPFSNRQVEREVVAGADSAEGGSAVAKQPVSHGRKVQGLRATLLEDKSPFLKHIANSMGERYVRATKACLEGEARLHLRPREDQSDIRVGARLRQAFIDEVVDPLKSIEV